MTDTLKAAGHFFFRYRNALFPVLFAAPLLIAPPRPFGNTAWDSVCAFGLLAVALGQSLRVITIGLDYVKRGGKNHRIYADRLVTAGIYAHCRNPMYVGNILIAVGMLCIIGQPWTLAAAGAFFIYAYIAIVHSEECYLHATFGQEYRDYCARSPRWIPRIHGVLATLRAYRFDWPAVIVKEYGTIFSTLILATALLAWKTWRTGALDRFLPAFIAAAALSVALWVIARWLKKGKNLKPRGTTPVEPTIPDLRRRIDAIDDSILRLLNNRAEIVAEVFHLKEVHGAERFDPSRVEQILHRLEGLNRGPLSNQQVRHLYSAMLGMFANDYMQPTPQTDPPVVVVPSLANAAQTAAAI